MSLDVSLSAVIKTEVFEANITHNLTTMAGEAGIYDVLWRPVENGFVYAKDIIPTLKKGVVELKNNPEKYKKFDDPGGWGVYDNFYPWVVRYLAACADYPDAVISVSR